MHQSSNIRLRYYRRIDNRLGPDIQGCYIVRWLGETTGATFKSVPIGPVFSANKTAFRTGLAGVFGINENHRDTKTSGLVFYKGFKLMKTPVMQSCSPRLSGLNTFPDTLQIFKGNGKQERLASVTIVLEIQ